MDLSLFRESVLVLTGLLSMPMVSLDNSREMVLSFRKEMGREPLIKLNGRVRVMERSYGVLGLQIRYVILSVDDTKAHDLDCW